MRPQNGHGEKRCEIQGGGQEMAVMVAAAEEVVDMSRGSAGLTQTYFYSLVR